MNKEKFSKIKKTKIYNLGLNNKYILLSFLCSVIVLLLTFFCYGVFPFGNKTILRMDLYHQYGPLFAELYDRITSGSSLVYSWTSGGGGSFLGNFFNYLSSPLSVFILLFGHINNPEAIAFLMLLKASLASAIFCYYLKNSKDFLKHDTSTAAFGVLYSFCGYFIAYYWNIMWLDAMLLLPLVVLGIEKIINDGKTSLYFISLAITIVSNYYAGFMVCIFSVLYAIMYYFGKYSFGTKIADNPNTLSKKKIDKLKNSKLFKSVYLFIGASIIAVLLCAFSLLPVYFILQSSSATSGTFPTTTSSYFAIFDFLANHLASLEPTIRSSGDDVLPNIYCGIATLILVTLYLLAKSVSLQEKISRVAMLLVFFFSFNTNILNYIWHGFHFPNDLPYRFSFMYSFMLLVIAYKALINIKDVSSKDILYVGLALTAFIVFVEKIGSKNVLEETVILSILFVIIYTIILSLFKNKKIHPNAVSALLLCCVITEATVCNTSHFIMDQQKENYTKDYYTFRALKDSLDELDDTDFYRMELTNLNMRMDPCWFGYNGVSTFSSMASEPLSNLQYNLGMYGNYINSYTYNLQTPIYNSMFSLKYIVNNSQNINMENTELYTKLMSNGNYTAYKNNYYLPIAYCVDRDIKNWNPISDNPFENQNDYLLKATEVGDVLEPIAFQDIEYYNINEFGEDANSGKFVFYKTDKNVTSSNFIVNYTLEKKQNVYIYVDSDCVSSDTITINANNEFVATQNIYEEYIYDIGLWDAGTTISIIIPINDEKASGYVDCFASGLDMEKYKTAYSKLNSESLNITKFTDTNIQGTVKAKEKCVLYTSIPYDKSWKVIVDGKEVPQNDILSINNALLGINLSSGEHSIEFKYKAKGLFAGITISSITIILLLAYSVNKKRKLQNNTLTVDSDIKMDLLTPENNKDNN